MATVAYKPKIYIDHTDLLILKTLIDNGGQLSLRILRQVIDLWHLNMSVHLDRLEEQKLVYLKVLPDDKRCKIAVITERGKKLSEFFRE